MEKATFAAEGLEQAFATVPGVRAVRGGSIEPAYEAVELDYDPWKVSFDGLLAVFWEAHDPTRPGSAIFPHTVEQHASAASSLERMRRRLGPDRPLSTAILSGGRFERR